MELVVFLVAGGACIVGALGVVLNSNPVHAALSLVGTLFGIAVLFIAQDANFLAAVQVIVYAGAIVVLFLFVIMLLGVDRNEDLRTETLKGQRQIAAVLGVLAVAELVALSRFHFVLGSKSTAGAASEAGANVELIGKSVFTRYLYAFEITSVLLIIAVIGAVVLSRRARPLQDAP